MKEFPVNPLTTDEEMNHRREISTRKSSSNDGEGMILKFKENWLPFKKRTD